MGNTFAGTAGAIGCFALLLGLLTLGKALPRPVALMVAGLIMLAVAGAARYHGGLQPENPHDS